MQKLLKQILVAGLMMLTLAVSVQAADVPRGTLAIIGGGLRPDNNQIWDRVVTLAGGPGAKIAVFPSASGSPEASGLNTIANLQRHGADAFLVPVSIRIKDIDYRLAVDDPVLAQKVRTAGGVFFTGGDQARITKVLLKEDGSRTLLLDAIWEMYRAGGVVAGTSAGAAIMSTTMFYDAKGVLATLKLGVNEGMEIAPGLGFIGPDMFVDQHLIIRGRFARMLPAMMKKEYKFGLGVDENTALIISNGTEVEVIGYKGAVLLDLTKAKTSPEIKDFNVSNVRISYLDTGDRYNFATRVFTPTKDKENGRVRPTAPYNSDTRFYTDILGNTTVVDLMQHLIDSRQERTIGLAFGSPGSIRPELGFEFEFSKVPESLGYFSSANGGEAYSVMNIRMDVRPIEMHLPLYHYR